MNRAFLAGMAILLSCHAAFAQAAGWQKAWDEKLAAARKEAKVVVAGPPDTQVRQLLPAAFEARFDVFDYNFTVTGKEEIRLRVKDILRR